MTDKATGKPVSFGTVEAAVFGDNPHLRDYPGAFDSYPPQVNTDPDGRYEIATMPGRGLISVRTNDEFYRGATGMEKIKGYDAKYQTFMTRPRWVSPRGQAAIAEVDPDPKAAEITLDLQVDPGRTIVVHAIDPEGKPIGNTVVKGLSESYPTSPYPQESSDFEVHALDPSRPRRLVVTHAGRKLIGSVYLKGDEAGPLTVQLQPWGTVVGRIVDDEGKPKPSMSLTNTDGSYSKHPEDSDVVPGGDWNGGLGLGNDGKFRVEGLVPGLKYHLSANESFTGVGKLIDDVIVKSGEVKDLGDLKVIPVKPE